MSPANSSAICVATASGIFASSVAAKSDERITPPAKRELATKGAISVRTLKAAASKDFSTVKRVKVGASSWDQRVVSLTKRLRPSACTVTKRPGRLSSAVRVATSVLINAAAVASTTPRRRSRVSAVSLERVVSVRYKTKGWVLLSPAMLSTERA